MIALLHVVIKDGSQYVLVLFWTLPTDWLTSKQGGNVR